MQTFLPYVDFVKTAQCLDWRRLGKQRVEAWQIIDVSIKVRENKNPKWKNHPARLMWEKHLNALCTYGIAICNEWISRGYRDTMRSKFLELRKRFEDNGNPLWMERQDFFLAHKSNLIRKGRERLIKKGKADVLNHYKGLWPDVPEDLPYVWPIQSLKVAGVA